MNKKTYSVKHSDINRTWHFVDATGETLGRLATKIATILTGKNKVMYSPHMDSGDYVVVTNARKIAVTGNKEMDKMYYRHSGYPGGFREENLKTVRERRPEKIILEAVSGMLPKNRIRDDRMARLKVYAGIKHPHKGQESERAESK